jgi:hypothetical protein
VRGSRALDKIEEDEKRREDRERARKAANAEKPTSETRKA